MCILKLLYSRQKYETKRITANRSKVRLNAIIADSPIKQAIGLMFRKGIKENECMLLVFGRPARYSIWMRDMLFPIDAMWLNERGDVVSMIEGIEPCHSLFLFCPVHKPRMPAKYVVETKSGFVKKHSVKIGTRFNLKSITAIK